jgi:hypothetical protein
MALGNQLLFLKLSEALGQPSRAYRAAKAGLDIPNQALEGFEKGSDLEDKMQGRRFERQTLEQALGGNVPDSVSPYRQLSVKQFKPTAELLTGIGSIERSGREKTPESLEAILSEKVRTGEMTMEQAAKIKRSFSPSAFPQPIKPPPGYSMSPDGTSLVPIPGGPAAREIGEQDQKKQTAKRAESERSRLVMDSADTALTNVKRAGTTGLSGKVARMFNYGPAEDLAGLLNTIKANLTFENLANMKANSPTGASGLGALSDYEGRLLASSRASLDQQQSDAQLAENIKKVKKHYANVLLINESQTGDPEADEAIARVISSESASDNEKRARIQGIRAAAGAQ